MAEKRLRERVAEWVDTYVIADLILSHIQNELERRPTFNLAKEVWLDELQHLGGHLAYQPQDIGK